MVEPINRSQILVVPKVGQSVRFKCIGLPGGLHPDTTYSFTCDRRGGRIILHVPGHHRGPDICKPSKPEQEAWLDGLTNLMIRSWGCEWCIFDEASLETFMKLIDPYSESYKVIIECRKR